jgi:cytoskeletal protein RodZ
MEDTKRAIEVGERQGGRPGALAAWLAEGLRRRALTVDDLAERTKVPRSTIQSFLDEPISALLPERVYLRGQLCSLARELRLDPVEGLRHFDARYPVSPWSEEVAERGRFSVGTITLAAGLGCIAVVAVVLAFATAL